jgi:hypothetical protein
MVLKTKMEWTSVGVLDIEMTFRIQGDKFGIAIILPRIEQDPNNLIEGTG